MPADTFEGALLDAELNNPALKIVAHLAKNAIPLDSDAVLIDDLVEADFPGYETLLLEAPVVDVFDEVNYAEAFYQSREWIAGEIVTPQVIYAVYVTIEMVGVGIVLNQIQILETPIIVDREGITIQRTFSVAATSEALS